MRCARVSVRSGSDVQKVIENSERLFEVWTQMMRALSLVRE
jgi:hypothetical protein